jgi:hypothetical protein
MMEYMVLCLVLVPFILEVLIREPGPGRAEK